MRWSFFLFLNFVWLCEKHFNSIIHNFPYVSFSCPRGMMKWKKRLRIDDSIPHSLILNFQSMPLLIFFITLLFAWIVIFFLMIWNDFSLNTLLFVCRVGIFVPIFRYFWRYLAYILFSCLFKWVKNDFVSLWIHYSFYDSFILYAYSKLFNRQAAKFLLYWFIVEGRAKSFWYWKRNFRAV